MRSKAHIGSFVALAFALTGSAASASETLHFAANTASYDEPVALGFNLFDTAPSRAALAELPAGGRALLWVGGDYGECAPQTSRRSFRSKVRRLRDDPRVFGWFLYDEPDLRRCEGLRHELRERVELIDRVAPQQRSFFVALDEGSRAQARVRADLIGIDPYPCRIDQACKLSLITRAVDHATRVGLPRRKLVPVFQVFGQSCARVPEKSWRLPTVNELDQMLRLWDRLLPAPVFDFAYSWDEQPYYSCPALATSPALHALIKAHNTG